MKEINHDLKVYRLNELTVRATIVGVAGYFLALGGMLAESASLVLVGIVAMGWAAITGVKTRSR